MPRVLTLILLLFAAGPLAGEPNPAAPGTILLMRHARAPGTGDPADFDTADCATQRNLDATGRAQARAIGEHLRAAGLPADTAVFTSVWCRCQETARLLGFAAPEVHPGLASFFDGHVDRTDTLDRLGAFLRELPRDGPPVILVTHQVNMTALTGRFPASGEIFVLRADGTARPALIGRLPPPAAKR